MRADFPALLDACVLANFGVCDLLLRLAEPPRLYLPFWSEEILAEVARTQIMSLKPPWPVHLVESWRREVRGHFPEAIVGGCPDPAAFPGVHAKDRHVMAAAVGAGAQVIVTFNLKHFPAPALTPHHIYAEHPQDFLLNLYAMEPETVLGKLGDIARQKSTDIEDVLLRLGKSVPEFSRVLLSDRGGTRGITGQ